MGEGHESETFKNDRRNSKNPCKQLALEIKHL